jgi:hypothetical protein
MIPRKLEMHEINIKVIKRCKPLNSGKFYSCIAVKAVNSALIDGERRRSC